MYFNRDESLRGLAEYHDGQQLNGIGKSLKKLGKKVGKVVKKAVPIAAGFASGGITGALAVGSKTLASSGKPKAKTPPSYAVMGAGSNAVVAQAERDAMPYGPYSGGGGGYGGEYDSTAYRTENEGGGGFLANVPAWVPLAGVGVLALVLLTRRN